MFSRSTDSPPPKFNDSDKSLIIHMLLYTGHTFVTVLEHDRSLFVIPLLAVPLVAWFIYRYY
jgi:hypothetical protein